MASVRAYVKLWLEGAKVAAFDVVEQNAIDSAEDVKALGRDSLAYRVNVVNYAELKKAVDDVIAKWGKLDIMCNNAGVSHERCPITPGRLPRRNSIAL